jgi:hypothetical protein
MTDWMRLAREPEASANNVDEGRESTRIYASGVRARGDGHAPSHLSERTEKTKELAPTSHTQFSDDAQHPQVPPERTSKELESGVAPFS